MFYASAEARGRIPGDYLANTSFKGKIHFAACARG